MKLTIFCAAIAAGAALLGCASAPEGAETFEYRETPVLINTGNHEIPAVVTVPVHEGRAFPAVVMLHGYGSNKDEAGDGYKLFAPELARRGIASIRIDFAGCGDSAVDHAAFDLYVGVADAQIAANYIAALPEIDSGRIGIMGWSKGGAIALLTAGIYPRFKSVLTWAGAPDLSGVYSPEGFAEAKRNGVYVATFEWRGPLSMSLDAFETAESTDILAQFSRSAAPVLAVNGSEDTSVLPETAERIRQASGNPDSRALIIPGADHTFNIFTGDMSAFNLLSRETINWFRKTL